MWLNSNNFIDFSFYHLKENNLSRYTILLLLSMEASLDRMQLQMKQ